MVLFIFYSIFYIKSVKTYFENLEPAENVCIPYFIYSVLYMTIGTSY